MGKGQELYQKAKSIIPGGTQLLSKRPEMFLPDQWPVYYSRANGCEVWDLDGNHYYDFAQMGVGSCTLGYNNPVISKAVKYAIDNGSMCTLNAYEEVELAEKLIEMNPWGDMVRFARTGGEINNIAIRIARAYTGKSRVAFCGYHGWHDWYISANLADDSRLDEQLLPGLKPAGVPRELLNTSLPFIYNDISSLETLIEKYGNTFAAIIMEPQRGTKPTQEFLQGVKTIAKCIGAVLMFDEVTSGFRMNIGGIHRTMGINPDIAIYGKALGNGHPIAAVVGKREIMEAAQTSFISSTFWTERIGFAAALSTIKEMERIDSTAHLIWAGKTINSIWTKAAEAQAIKIHLEGIEPLTHINFDYENSTEVLTLYSQLMLEKGFLLGAAVYTTTAYTEDILKKFEDATNESFEVIAKAVKNGNVKDLLKGPVKHTGFARLVY
jgi:Glutamate-1-semialdehyde aminotransferase